MREKKCFKCKKTQNDPYIMYVIIGDKVYDICDSCDLKGEKNCFDCDGIIPAGQGLKANRDGNIEFICSFCGNS